ncbi:MAG TPA: DUF3152 domain-containing protein [Jatrophihabitans sp.]|nr:DUF3152 domain-containing protein [Jatrophihabitans sp.]
MTRSSAQQGHRHAAGGPTAGGPAGRRPDGKSRWRAFAGRYGWRAYALPALAVVSVLAIFNIGSHRDHPPARAAGSVQPPLSTVASTPVAPSSRPAVSSSSRSAAASSQRTSSSAPASSPAVRVPSWQLPAGPAYSFSASGTFSTLPGTSGVLGKGQLYRFSIDVENGVTGTDSKSFATAVMAALSDQRSWIGSGRVALQRVDSGPVDFRITLAAPTTVRRMCGYSLRIETSCNAGSEGRVVLNVSRWVRGAQVFAGDLADYHRYAVNHEVGHALGHNHAHNCLGNGLAPAMMQQSIGTRTASGQACRPNPWPFPPGASDAPGAEQVGDAADAEFFRRNYA